MYFFKFVLLDVLLLYTANSLMSLIKLNNRYRNALNPIHLFGRELHVPQLFSMRVMRFVNKRLPMEEKASPNQKNI